MPKRLQEQVVTIPLGGKLDESVDPKLADTSTLSAAKNIIYDKTGLATKSKGYSIVSHSFGETGKECSFNTLAAHSSELLAGGYYKNSSNGYSLTSDYYQLCSFADSDDKFYKRGFWTPLVQSKSKAVYTEDSITMPTVARANGLIYYAWIYGSAPYACIVDETTGTTVYDAAMIEGQGSNGWTSPHWQLVGDTLHLYYANAAGGDKIRQCLVDSATPTTIGSPSTVTTGSTTALLLDVDIADDTSYGECAFIVYADSSDQIEIKSFDEDGTARRTYTTGIDVDDVLCIKGITNYDTGSEYLAVAYGYYDSGASVMYSMYFVHEISSASFITSATSVIAHGNIDLENITLCEDPADSYGKGADYSAIRILVQEHTAGAYRTVRSCRARITTGAIYENEDKKLYHYRLLSKAFQHRGRAHVWCKYDTGWAGDDETQPRAVLFCYGADSASDSTLIPVTEAVWQIDTARSMESSHLPNVVETSDTHGFLWPSIEDTYSVDETATRKVVTRTLTGNTLIYDDEERHDTATAGPDMMIGGGLVYTYDGACQDHGFIHAPEIYTATASVTGGDIEVTAGGAYQWCATYEWTDKNGQWHRSAPSVVQEHTFGSGTTNKMTLLVKPLLAGNWQRNIESGAVKICLYRTQEDGSVFQLVDSTNNVHNYHVEFEDTANDQSIQDNRYLYTTGGVLPNTTPPPGHIIHRHNDRIFVVNDENPKQLYYTKPFEANIAPEFTIDMSYVFPDDIVALSTAGQDLVAFSEYKTYILRGDGLDVLGGGGFYPLETVLETTGCSNRNSVAKTDLGLVFQNDKGIHVLTGAGFETISDPVKDLVSGHDIYRVLSPAAERRLYFLMDNSKFLVFDYEHTRWTELDYYTNIVEAKRVNADIYYISNTDVLYKQNSVYTYGLTGKISYELETPWIKVGSLTGYQRVWWINILGEYKSDHTMTVSIYTDYDDSSAVQSEDITVTNSTPFLARIKPQYQKCGTIKVKISDKNLSSNYRSADLTAIELVCGFKATKAINYSNDK